MSSDLRRSKVCKLWANDMLKKEEKKRFAAKCGGKWHAKKGGGKMICCPIKGCIKMPLGKCTGGAVIDLFLFHFPFFSTRTLYVFYKYNYYCVHKIHTVHTPAVKKLKHPIWRCIEVPCNSRNWYLPIPPLPKNILCTCSRDGDTQEKSFVCDSRRVWWIYAPLGKAQFHLNSHWVFSSFEYPFH